MSQSITAVSSEPQAANYFLVKLDNVPKLKLFRPFSALQTAQSNSRLLTASELLSGVAESLQTADKHTQNTH